MPLHIGDADESIVERREDVGDADENVFRTFSFDDFFASQIVGQQLGGGWRGGDRSIRSFRSVSPCSGSASSAFGRCGGFPGSLFGFVGFFCSGLFSRFFSGAFGLSFFLWRGFLFFVSHMLPER